MAHELTARHLMEPHRITADTVAPDLKDLENLLLSIAGERKECYPYRCGQAQVLLHFAIEEIIRAKRHVAELQDALRNEGVEV